ncbi:Oxidoreductase [Artemisia annua]|uniref:Oxidoreductase n=1 Tax=Artemisia annua TaxID=35608 RepID=A0A2U1NRZ1_ARTAN|nr:Oxidoreductase [Artemisia annua]
MTETRIRFGILGCANIARKVSRAMLLSPNTTISAVGSRSLNKATAFALENHFPESAKVYGSYDAVLDDPDVDAVYVPLPTSLHLKWAVLAAEKKKHILLEKPVALNVGELDTILEACESSGVQFMDATMWMHHPPRDIHIPSHQPKLSTQNFHIQKMTETRIRFGILGCANIARKVSRAMLLSPNTTISAVGSRSLNKATAFALENHFPESAKVYGSYDAVLDDPDVDAVYVPLPTSLHLKWAVLAAEKKKHILLEKPVALNVGELDTILEACESSGVQFMDATMWMHHPRTVKMKDILCDQQKFGQLKSVHSNFSYKGEGDFLKNDIRVNPNLDSLGALGDQGWYSIRAILWANDYELPKTVTALRDPEYNELGVILSCGASLNWNESGKVATFYCSFLSNLSMDIIALGTKGNFRVHDFVIPFNEKVGPFYAVANSRWAELSTGCVPEPSEFKITTDLPQEALMVQEFARLVEGICNGEAKPEKKWPILSRKTQLVIDAVITSIKNGFEPVEVVY